MPHEIALRVFDRWGANPPNEDFARKELGELLAISLGLGALFNENQAAERRWMASVHPKLGGTPLNFVLAGQTAAVLEVVNEERGL